MMVDDIDAAVGSAYGVKVAPAAQKQRDDDAVKILQAEFQREYGRLQSGKTDAAANIQSITRELKRLGVSPPAVGPIPAAPAASAAAPPEVDDIEAAVKSAYEQPATPTKSSKVREALTNIFGAPYRALTGAGEAGAQLVTGAAAAVPAGIAGLGAALLPGPEGQGAEVTRKIQEALTYQPRTEAGKQASELVAKAFEAGSMGAQERGQKVVEATGSPAAAVLAEQLTNPLNYLPLVPTAARGARAAVRPITETMAQWKGQLEPGAAPVTPVIPGAAPGTPGTPAGRGSVGAAGVTKQTEVNALLTEASPELKQQLTTLPPERINTDALQTRLLEDKYGINLTEGQRTGNRNAYASEWNNRGAHPQTLAPLFENQPKQMMEAIDNLKTTLTPDIRTSSPSELGQTVIDALRKRDQARQLDIDNKYAALRDAAGGDFPVDSKQLLSNVEKAFKKDVNWTAGQKLDPFIELQRLADANEMTYDSFLAMRRNLGRLQASPDGTTRGLATLMINELEKLPLRSEVQALQPLANEARKAAKERFDVIKRNPAYKEAIAVDLTPEEMAAGVPARGAELFIDKHTRQKNSLLRLLDEVGKESPAHQAIRAHELDKLKVSAGFKEGRGDLSPRGITNYMHKTGDRLLDIYGPEGIKNLQELDILSSKIGQPKTGVFNHSNSTAAAIAEMAKRGITTGLEGWAAAHTGGASVPITQVGRKFFENKKAERFGRQATDPLAGIVLKE